MGSLPLTRCGGTLDDDPECRSSLELPLLYAFQTGWRDALEPVWMATSGLHLGQEAVKEIFALPKSCRLG
jgi:hypothetical protein